MGRNLLGLNNFYGNKNVDAHFDFKLKCKRRHYIYFCSTEKQTIISFELELSSLGEVVLKLLVGTTFAPLVGS